VGEVAPWVGIVTVVLVWSGPDLSSGTQAAEAKARKKKRD
jgi:hypothetical protein